MKNFNFVKAAILLSCFLPSLARADILVGVAGPMTGPLAAFGEEMKLGVALALEDVHEAGGLLGEKTGLAVQDDGCEPKQASSVAALLATKNSKLILGHICSAGTIPASDVYEENNILLFSPLVQLDEITKRGRKNLFRFASNNSNYAAFIADYVREKLQAQKIVIIGNKLAITQELGRKTQENLKQKNIHADYLDFNNGESDYTALVARLKSINPDVVVCACYPKEAGLIIRQAKEAGVGAKFLGYVTFSSIDFANIAGKYSDDVLVVDYAFPEKNAAYQRLVKRLQEKKQPLESTTFLSYAAIQVYDQAVRLAGSLETGKIVPVLHKTEFDTVIGKVKFDQNGDIAKPDFRVRVWKDRKLVPVAAK